MATQVGVRCLFRHLWGIGFLGFLVLLFLGNLPVFADDSDLFTISVRPNVLIILDNSNSMDEGFFGNAVGSFSPGSKSVVGRNVLTGLINAYVNSMRVGLMTYRLPSSSKWHLHNSAYFASYEPKSYCPNPPDACVEYCQTGQASSQATCQAACSAQNALFDATYFDEIISTSFIGTPKRNKYCNLIYPKTIMDPTYSIYYKQALPFYDSANNGTEFDYSPGYSTNEYPGTTNSYRRYRSKAGTSDLEVGYSTLFSTTGFLPTDSDYALGYANFGRRLFSYHVGRTWFSNGSEGNGYLHVEARDNNSANNDQLNALLAKLAPNENNETGYMSCTNTTNPNQCSYIVNSGLTPTAGVLQSAINYFMGSGGYTTPIQYSCQKNFIVYVTDGLPSHDENGAPGAASVLMDAVLGKLNTLRNLSVSVGGISSPFDIKTFIVGVGLGKNDKAFLDSMALAGGTDVGGLAYYADNPDQLATALSAVFSNIIENGYSFTLVSVTSTRAIDENYIYEASFEPLNAEPFWRGHLRKYSILSDGSVGSVLWDAGSILRSTAAGDRTMMTYKSDPSNPLAPGLLVPFTNLSPGDLGVSTIDERTAIVGFFRGEAAYNAENQTKLGDIYHSNPVTVGTPSFYFADINDRNNAFDQFRTNHSRTSANGKRVVIVGANDGQVHAFRTSNGSEAWSFIPPNFLGRLKDVAHSSHPTLKAHQYFVDGPVTVADAWLGTEDYSHKSDLNWKTVLIFGQGRGGGSSLWSSSTSCDSGFSANYSSSYPNYCGYYAFDLTDTTNPGKLWSNLSMNINSSQAPYLGAPWSKIAIGRVKINGSEKWVGFFGAGYSSQSCGATGECDLKGKGFLVVDLSNGNILWSYTRGDNENINYSFAGTASIVDSDNDGFIDSAYMGDIGGNVWRFKFCPVNALSTCNVADWRGSLFFRNTGEAHPIYTTPTVTRDQSGNLWVYWGTGDRSDPTNTSTHDNFLGVKDTLCSGNWAITDLEDITSGTYFDAPNKHGWYIQLSGGGEKILDEPTIFGGIAYFATYTPTSGADPCSRAGIGKLYGLRYTNGSSVLSDPNGPPGTLTRSITIGAGIPIGPIISFKPSGAIPPDMYVTESGGTGGTGNLGNPVSTRRMDFNPPTVANRTNMLFWQDLRVQ